MVLTIIRVKGREAIATIGSCIWCFAHERGRGLQRREGTTISQLYAPTFGVYHHSFAFIWGYVWQWDRKTEIAQSWNCKKQHHHHVIMRFNQCIQGQINLIYEFVCDHIVGWKATDQSAVTVAFKFQTILGFPNSCLVDLKNPSAKVFSCWIDIETSCSLSVVL